jgi:uncharacterized protein YdcH (DUF465 family)
MLQNSADSNARFVRVFDDSLSMADRIEVSLEAESGNEDEDSVLE